jgi:TonB-linked SusC/RagA family outer membrane protein
MKQKLLSILLLCTLLIGTAYAQSRTISGKVTSAEDGSSLPGVSVLVQGTSTGTQTDANGNYSINVPANANGLVFRFIGFINQTVTLGSTNTVNVALLIDASELSEVVVVGYGTIERKNLTGAVASVKGDALKNLASPSVDRQLSGQVSGVQASTNSGILGQPARIRIRGTNSISNSSDPLFVVDGMPYITGNQGINTAYNPLADISPNDIESVEVLKDGSATAIYGSRAANGVVLITTKRGTKGATKVSYDGWIASSSAAKRFDLLNAAQFIEISNEKQANAGGGAIAFPTPNPAGGDYDTDWQDYILRTAFQQNHALSISGANDATNYYLSLGYANMEGTTIGNTLTRYNFRANLEHKLFNNRLTLGANAAITHNGNTGLNTGTGTANLSGNIAAAIRSFPNVPVKNEDGTFNVDFANNVLGGGANKLRISDNYPNVAYLIANNIYKNQSLNVTGSAFARVNIYDGLSATTQIGISHLGLDDYVYWNPLHGDGKGNGGYVSQYYQPQFRYNWQNLLNYNKTIADDHRLDLVVGQELQKSSYRWINAAGTSLADPYFAQNGNLVTGSLANPSIGGSLSERAFESYFARANYAYQGKYLLSATIRHDKISSLPWGNQGATLPGGSIGWRVSQENFWANSSLASWFNDFKVRGGYAKVGNVEIGNYPYAGTYRVAMYGSESAFVYSNMANPDLRFETSEKYNVGADAEFLGGRLGLTVDFFRQNVDNLILNAPTAPSLGVPGNTISKNVGAMYNQGWEFSVNGRVMESDKFTWASNLNLTLVKNRVTRLDDGGADLINTYNITRIGHSIGEFYGFEYKGVNPANGNPLWSKADGTIIQGNIADQAYYKYDASNPNDFSAGAKSSLVAGDRKILGIANPTWFGGFNNTFSYNQFDLNVFLTFSGGNKIYNYTRQEGLNNQKFLNNGAEIMNRWTAPGQVTDVPKVWFGRDNFTNRNGFMNSRFLENGNFLRAQNISLGYSFDSSLAQKLSAKSFRVYASVQNAFVITNYSGLDPELSSSSTTNRAPGLDWNVNPVPRTFTFGLNLIF